VCDIKLYVSKSPFIVAEVSDFEEDVAAVLWEPDGWGIMWCEPSGRVYWKKTLSRNDFLGFLEELADRQVLWFAMHGRTATAGDVDLRNAHPVEFRVGRSTYLLMHNGVVSIPTPPGLSDTFMFLRLLVMISREFGVGARDELMREGGGFFVFWDAARHELVAAGSLPSYYLWRCGDILCVSKTMSGEEFVGTLDILRYDVRRRKLRFVLRSEEWYGGRLGGGSYEFYPYAV